MKTLADLQAVYRLPLPDLLYRAATVHREHHDPADIQRCVLLSCDPEIRVLSNGAIACPWWSIV